MTSGHGVLQILHMYVELHNTISFLKYSFLLNRVYFDMSNFEILKRY